jgi:hypothetical protein
MGRGECEDHKALDHEGLAYLSSRTEGKLLIRPADIDGFLTKSQIHPVDLDAMVEDVLKSLKTDAALSS